MLDCGMGKVGGLFREHASRWTVAVWLVAAAGAGMLVWIAVADTELPPDSSGLLLASLVTVVSYGAAGAVLIDRRPDLPFGWVLAGVSITQVVAVPALVVSFQAWQDGDTGLWVRAGAASSSLLFLPVAAQGIINVRFPSGHPASGRSRKLETAIVVGTALSVIGGAILAASVAGARPTTANGSFFGVEASTVGARVGSSLQVLTPVVVLLGLVAGIGVVVRYRRARGLERQQLAWRAAGVVVTLLLFPFAVAEVTPGWLDALDPLVFVLTLAIPVLRYRLWAIDTIVRRSVVYGFVTVVLAVAYVALAAVGTSLASDQVTAPVAAVAVAFMFAPLRTRAQQLVDRVAYGDRSDPYRTLSELDRRLAQIGAPGAVLPTIVETIGASLRLPYVGIERIDGSLIALHGDRSDRVERWSLTHEGISQGYLVASPRRGQDDFDDRDRQLLGDVARHAGVAVHAETLTADLIASRQRLVTAREEERRRLRRDLHDGLGPTLTGVGLNLDAARSQIHGDPAAAEQLIHDAKAATSTAIDDVRRLVYGLRPPVLDNLGFIGAIRHQTEHFSTNGCQVSLEVAGVPELPAAIEVAAYRTVIEAVTNAIRHGRAHRCSVRLGARPDILEVDIDDDGTSTASWTPGVGLLSMREQAAELGGTIEAGPNVNGGASVRARYPITAVGA